MSRDVWGDKSHWSYVRYVPYFLRANFFHTQSSHNPIYLALYRAEVATGGTFPSRSNLPFLISDIQALWRSWLSARVPECQKLKMYVRPGWHSILLNVTV